MKKVLVSSIVFLQGDDYYQMIDDLGDNDSEDDIIEYLFQWLNGPDNLEYNQQEYNAEDINTEFLGYKRRIDGEDYLFSHNPRLGYAGLSKIMGYKEA